MILKQGISWGIKNPKKLFLIDGLGAILSAFLLGVVLVELEMYFGIPRSALYFLAFFPLLFAVYDIYCYGTQSITLGEYLKFLALLNISYCLLSISVAIYHFQIITFFGWSYFILEIFVVFTIAAIEWNVARNLILNKNT